MKTIEDLKKENKEIEDLKNMILENKADYMGERIGNMTFGGP